MPELLAIPNFSGVDAAPAIGAALTAAGARVLDVHRDPDHNRSVFTLAGALVEALVAGAQVALAHVDLSSHTGLHPHVGVLDIAAVVYLGEADRGPACATALVLGDELARRAGLPVLLYGELAGGRTRAFLRRGGPAALAARIAAGELKPDFAPAGAAAPDPRAGVTLVGARPPLIALNAELAPPATLDDARAIAAAIRESGPGGLPGVRAIGLWLTSRGVAQVSMNLEDHRRTSPRDVVAAIERHAQVAACEVVGLPPRAAFDGFPTARVRNLRFLEDVL